ncbi:hypothetical protein WMY93_025565 [Mugilogobius chulae]|uniref:Exoribonuclease phosphorolytic domain-containing protein n=1 Tax=Mugilogobius chulae TaxID=88201 RepID=A0AAW0MW09_9GOBI
MPTDTKRVKGPELSQSPSVFQRKPPLADRPTSRGTRQDGRQRDQVDVRSVFVRCGLVSQAKGSAYMEAGNTKVICCVYGPRETERKDETDMKCGSLNQISGLQSDGEMTEETLTAGVRTCMRDVINCTLSFSKLLPKQYVMLPPPPES